MKGADRGARPLMILLKRTCSGQLRVFAGAAPLALPHCFSLTAGGSTPRCCWRRPVEYACSHPTARAKSAAAGRCRMPLRASTVSFKSPTGITHGVDVEAETVYEAAGVSLARLKKVLSFRLDSSCGALGRTADKFDLESPYMTACPVADVPSPRIAGLPHRRVPCGGHGPPTPSSPGGSAPSRVGAVQRRQPNPTDGDPIRRGTAVSKRAIRPGRNRHGRPLHL